MISLSWYHSVHDETPGSIVQLGMGNSTRTTIYTREYDGITRVYKMHRYHDVKMYTWRTGAHLTLGTPHWPFDPFFWFDTNYSIFSTHACWGYTASDHDHENISSNFGTAKRGGGCKKTVLWWDILILVRCLLATCRLGHGIVPTENSRHTPLRWGKVLNTKTTKQVKKKLRTLRQTQTC